MECQATLKGAKVSDHHLTGLLAYDSLGTFSGVRHYTVWPVSTVLLPCIKMYLLCTNSMAHAKFCTIVKMRITLPSLDNPEMRRPFHLALVSNAWVDQLLLLILTFTKRATSTVGDNHDISYHCANKTLLPFAYSFSTGRDVGLHGQNTTGRDINKVCAQQSRCS